MQKADCKICRRSGIKLFLKGDRCVTQKCAMIKKPYAPGQKSKKRQRALTEYGRELMEKQRLKKWYNLNETQLKNYVRKLLRKQKQTKDPAILLIKTLESRLDNVAFRMGIAVSRSQARQLVSHGFLLVNGKSVDIPSCMVKKGDIVSIKPQKSKKTIFQHINNLLKRHKAPSWLQFNAEKTEWKVADEPTLEEAAPPADIPAIFGFYSR